jgi:hypothetical protein
MASAAAAQAAAQISVAQRAQQMALAGLRSSQLQAQSIAGVLAQAASGNTPATRAALPVAAPVQGGNQGGGSQSGGSSGGGNPSGIRGGLLNILV